MRTRSILLFLLCLPISMLFGKGLGDGELTSSSAVPDKINSVEHWLAAEVLEDQTMTIMMNQTQEEFWGYIENNDVDRITIDFFWKSKNGNEIGKIATTVLDDFYNNDFSVDNWFFPLEAVDTVNRIYLAQVALNEAECGPKVEIPLLDQFEEEEEELPIELPEYICGETYDYEELETSSLANPPEEGDIWFIGGFPILLGTVSASAPYSGTGIIPLPFDNKVVSVTFDALTVNSKFQVTDGQVHAVKGDLGDYPNFSVPRDTLTIGGEICVDLPDEDATAEMERVYGPDGLDQLGFDSSGYHPGTMSMYDSMGYDVDGYDQNDCNRSQLNRAGETCQNYSPTSPEATAYAEEQKDKIQEEIAAILAALIKEKQDSLALVNCDNIRTNLITLVNQSDVDKTIYFGENDEYLLKGLHEKFTSRPEPLANAVFRDPIIVDIETAHIDLYSCDQILGNLETKSALLDELATDETVLEKILTAIKNWTVEEYNNYSNNPENLNLWLSQQIDDLMNQNEASIDGNTSIWPQSSPFLLPNNDAINRNALYANQILINSQNQQNLQDGSGYNRFVYDHGPNMANSTVSIGNSVFSDDFTLADASFELNQGAEYINGVHRIHFLAELAKQLSFNPEEDRTNLLPFTIDKTVLGKTYQIIIDNIVFSPNGAVLDAYALIEDPTTGQKIGFRGYGIGFGPTGVTDESKLSLLGVDVSIKLNDVSRLYIKGNEDTYVAWDCDGFSHFGIDAEVEICRKLITPLDPQTLDTIEGDENYFIPIKIERVEGWLEFHATVSAPPFALTKAKDIKWVLSEMILDFSSSETPEFTPLMGYTSPFYNETTKVMAPQWKGFYMKNLLVELPKNFTKTDLGSDGTETTQSGTVLNRIEAEDILIDDCGFTGKVSVEREVVSLEKGNLDGWPLSIEGFEFKVIKTSFAGAGLKGKIKVPVFEEPMKYEAVMYPNDQYSFTVKVDSAITAPLFLAKVTLEEDSEIQVGKTDGKFIAKAILNGRLDINSDTSTAAIKPKFKGVCFEGFEVGNVAPYFSPGVWGLHSSSDDKNDVGGFPIRLSEIKPYKGAVDEEVGLALGVDLILGDTALGLNANGKMRIKAKLADDNGRQKWVYDGIKLDSLSIDASFPGVERLRGYLSFYGEESNPDPTWGIGFRGILDVQFKGFKVDLKAVSQFGKKSDFKYFFVDAMVNFEDGIPIGPSFTMKGFGGGASNNLKIVEEKIDFSVSGNRDLPGIGESFSGTTYAPDKSKGLGIKASLAFATAGKKSVFDGYASFSMLFNDNNGIDQMTLKGNGEFLAEWDAETLKTFKNAPKYESDSDEAPEKIKSPFSAFVSLNFNFAEPSFHGLLNVFLTDPSGTGTVEGSGTGGKVVDATLHFDPNDWYIWVGRTRSERELAGLIFKLPFIGGVNGSAYFQIGTKTDPMLPLPAEVREIAYKVNDNKTLRTSGAGMVFGGRVNVEMEAKMKKIIDARLAAGLGFDIMIRKYKGVSCLETGDDIGINGWYGSGQGYFYAIGSLKLAGINLAELGVAGVLQLRLPNPIFAQTTLGMKLKIGILKIKGSLKLKLGKDCTLVSDDPNQALGMEIISALTPGDEETDVPTNQQPEIHFNVPLGKDFSVFDLNQTEQTFRAELITSIRKTGLFDDNGTTIPFELEYNEDNTSVKLVPLNTFAGNDSITFKAAVQVYRNGAPFHIEEREVTFATGEALDYIPESNIAYAYPVDGMNNFFKKQHPSKIGYIQLVSGQANLFTNLPEGTKKQVRITSADGTEQLVAFTYEETSRRITYPIDPSIIQNGHLYKVDVLKTSGGQADPTNALTTPTTSDNSFATDRSDDAVYTAYFRSSEYDRFEDKIRAISVENENAPPAPAGKFDRYNYLTVSEKFDKIEINGSGNIAPLVSFKVDLDNDWIQRDIKPYLERFNIANPCEFLEFPKEGLEEGAGVTGPISAEVNSVSFDAGNYTTIPLTQSMTFDLEKAVDDLAAFADQARIECTGNNLDAQLQICREEGKSAEECANLIGLTRQPYPAMRRGEYKVSAKYQLPGISAGGTSILYFDKD